MATCNYLPGILLLSFIGVYIGIGSNNIESQEPRTKSQDLRPVFGNVVHLSSANLNLEKAATQTSDFRPPTSTLLRNQVKTIYDSQIGVRETGSNRGPEVEKYLRYVNVSKGNPWCAAFVCWVLGEAGVANPKTGWSPGLFPVKHVIWKRAESGKLKAETRLAPNASTVPNLATGNQPTGQAGEQLVTGYPPSLVTDNWQLVTSSPQFARSYVRQTPPTTGDVFGIFFPEKKRIAHVGFVDVWDGSWLITVEGNTNTSGGRDGDGVYRKRRPVRSIYRVTRYIN